MNGLDKYEEEKLMVLKMSRFFNKPIEEIIKNAIRNEYEAFLLTKTVYEAFKKFSGDDEL